MRLMVVIVALFLPPGNVALEITIFLTVITGNGGSGHIDLCEQDW